MKMNEEELKRFVEAQVKAILKEQQNQEPEKDEHGCTIGKQRWDPESKTCVPIPPQAQEAEWINVLSCSEKQKVLSRVESELKKRGVPFE